MILRAFTLVALLTGACSPRALPPAALSSPAVGLAAPEIIGRHIAAVGGQASIDAICSLEYTLHMKDAKLGEMDAVYRVNKDGQMRIDILKGRRRVYTEAYDGHRGWDADSKGVATDDPAGATLWHGTQLPGQILDLLDLPSRGHRVVLAGREVVDGVDYYVLAVTLSDGFQTYRYVDPQTWLISRGRDFRAFHPALDGSKTWLETVWSDYRAVGGVMRAFTSTVTDMQTGAWQGTTLVAGIKVNPPFDPAMFVTPASPD